MPLVTDTTTHFLVTIWWTQYPDRNSNQKRGGGNEEKVWIERLFKILNLLAIYSLTTKRFRVITKIIIIHGTNELKHINIYQNKYVY